MPGDDRDEPVDLGAPDRGGDVGAGDEAPPLFVEVDGVCDGELAEPVALVERDALALREPRQRAVHRARVEVAEAEPRREAARDRALSGPRGAVDGNDHLCDYRSQEVVEAGEAYRYGLRTLDAHAFARDEACDRAEDRDPVVAGGVDDASLRARGDSPDDEAVGGVPDPDSQRAERIRHRLDPVRLLRAQLCGTADDAVAARHRRPRARRAAARRSAAAPRRARSRWRSARRARPRGRRPARRRTTCGCRARSARPSARGRRGGRCGSG